MGATGRVDDVAAARSDDVAPKRRRTPHEQYLYPAAVAAVVVQITEEGVGNILTRKTLRHAIVLPRLHFDLPFVDEYYQIQKDERITFGRVPHHLRQLHVG